MSLEQFDSGILGSECPGGELNLSFEEQQVWDVSMLVACSSYDGDWMATWGYRKSIEKLSGLF